MRIRKATTRDAKSLLKMNDELFFSDIALLDSTVKKLQMNVERGLRKRLPDINKMLQSKNTIVLLLEESKPVGFVSGKIYKDLGDMEFDIYIKKPYRRKGFGKMLIKDLSAIAKEKGCKTISLQTYSANMNAKAVYKKLGFVQISERYRKKL
jgi:ribosomal protein S18 acetylase RimI-like enzyme